MQFPASL